MRRHAIFVLLFAASVALLFSAPIAGAQSVPVTSAARASALVSKAIDAMGGQAALDSLGLVRRTMTGIRPDVAQGLAPGRPSNNHPRLEVITDVRGGRYARLLRDTIVGGQPIEAHYALGPAGGFTANLIKRTSSLIPTSGVPALIASQARRWPETLLPVVASRPENLRHVGLLSWNGRSVEAVAYADAAGVQLDLFFDRRSGYLFGVSWLGDDAVTGDQANEVVFDDWRPVGNVRLPFRYLERAAASDLQRLTAADIRVTDERDSLFVGPAGFVTPRPAAARVEQLAEGVWLFNGAYTSMAVATDSGVIVLEAGGGTVAGRRLLADVTAAIPGMRIRRVIATHAHHDHLAGLRPFIAAGVTIVTTEQAATVVRAMSAAPHTFRPDDLSRSPKQPMIETVRDRASFGSGNQHLDVYMISSPHVQQLLIAHLPAQRVLFVADVVDLDEGTAVPVGEDTRQLAAAIARLGLAVDRIVAVHGGIADRALLDTALAGR